MLLWSGSVIGALALLLGLAYLAGGGRQPGGSELLDAVRKTAAEPSVALPLAFALLIALAYGARRLRLEWLAWRPGRIQVPDFTAPGIASASARQLSDKFRDRLAGMRLASSTAAPSTQTESNFLDVLGSTGVSSSNVLGTLLALLQAAVPSFTHEIRGTVVELAGSPRKYRVSLQIARLPNGGFSQVDVEEADLDRAIRRAADSATAAILPQTRLCRGPWVAWRRYTMPGELFSAYEDACRHEEQRHYDLAHELYYRALEYDPMNLMLRLELGQLQEKLQMFLEALVTYTAMEFIARPADAALPAGLYRRRAERERERALLLARYRRAVLLAEWSFVREWSETAAGDSARAVRGGALRDQLRPWLARRLGQSESSRNESPAAMALLDRLAMGKPLCRQQQLDLHGALTKLAGDEIARLRRDLPHWTWLGRRPPLTVRALDLTGLCIDERGRASPPREGRPRTVRELKTAVRKIEKPYPRLRRQTLQRWSEHYNAACLFAIALLGEVDERDRDKYAEHAIERLERAAASADSSFIVRQRDWVTTEDPDLDRLRPRAPFKAFEAQYFPASQPTVRRPIDEPQLAEVRCTRDLLIAVARAWEEVWRKRAAAAPEDGPRVGERWWRDEHEAWRHVHEVSLKRDWRSRLELVQATRRWQASYGLERVESVFARYEQDALAVREDSEVDTVAEGEIEATNKRLSDVAQAILASNSNSNSNGNGAAPAPFRGFTWGVSVLDRCDEEPGSLTCKARARLYRRQALLWRATHRWVELADGEGPDDHRKRFADELAGAKRLWWISAREREARRWGRGEVLR